MLESGRPGARHEWRLPFAMRVCPATGCAALNEKQWQRSAARAWRAPAQASFDSASGELSVSFVNATASSSSGTFVGQAMSYAYTLAPAVPEPANGTLLLLALGAFGLHSMRRRPRASAAFGAKRGRRPANLS